MDEKARLLILKIGGKVVDDLRALRPLLADYAALEGARILVHGGGKAATEVAARLGVEARLVDGRRITDAAFLEVAVMVYGGLANKRIVGLLQAEGADALGLSGADLDVIRAHKRPVGTIDYGFAGDIDRINTRRLQQLLSTGCLPVLAPLTHDGQGQMLNTNADTIASTVAKAMSGKYAVELVYCFEKAGVLRDPEDERSVIPELTPQRYLDYRHEGVIAGGMIPKLDNAFAALQAGVSRVRICNARGIAHLDSPSFQGTTLCL